MTDPDDVTRLLQEIGHREGAADELLPLVYAQLQELARKKLRTERAGHTLQATALVHEAYVRILGGRPIPWNDRGHFYVVAAEAMRRVLIDHARTRNSRKRGGDHQEVSFTRIELVEEYDLDEVLALDDALGRLEAEDERAARIVKLRFFAGLSVDDTAAALDVSARTVAREWEWARARLFELLGDEGEKPA